MGLKQVKVDEVKNSYIMAGGMRLICIGNNPLEPGDMCWTDGKYIYGHIPFRSTPAIPRPEDGIPVVLDVGKGNGKKARKGYVTQAGAWKRCEVKHGDWIANDGRCLYYGGEEFAGRKVLDAEVAEDGGLYVVTAGEYRKSVAFWHEFLRFTDFNMYAHPWFEHIFDEKPARIDYHIIPNKRIKESKKYGKEEMRDQKILIQKNGAIMYEIGLDVVANKLKEKIVSMFEQEFEQGEKVKILPGIMLEKKNFVASIVAYPLFFKINMDGTWNAVVSCSGIGYSFQKGELNTRYNSCYYNVADGWIYIHYDDLHCIPCGGSAQYLLDSNGRMDEICSHLFKGGKIKTEHMGINDGIDANTRSWVRLKLSWDVNDVDCRDDLLLAVKLSEIEIDLSWNIKNKDNDISFPVDEYVCSIDKFGRMTVSDGNRNVLAQNLVVDENYLRIEIVASTKYESNMFKETGIVICEIPTVKYRVYTPDGNVEEKEGSLYDDSLPYPVMDGCYKVVGDTCETFHFSVAVEKVGQGHLIGIQGGKLYLARNGTVQEIEGDNLRNFRIRRMRNLANARKGKGAS